MRAEASVPNDPVQCTLCGGRTVGHAADLRRSYLRCDHCGLIFAHPSSHPDRDTEKAIYDLHENDPADPGYRAFLSRLTMPLLERLSPGMEGLDYGCGPGPALPVMLEEAGMRVTCFDPVYSPDDSVLGRRYDFVTCTEVVEHFHCPARDWCRLASLLCPGGWLGVMTRMVPEQQSFHQWHYRNDPTHVSFYTPKVMRWLADELDLRMGFMEGDVVLMQKPS